MNSKLVVATHNVHKTAEIRQILGDRFAEIVDLSAFPDIDPAIEDGDTFEENSRIKALHASTRIPGSTVLADDSGLEVDSLGLAPGVYSARYAGEGATDADNREKLLAELGSAETRTARFRCVLTLSRDDQVLHVCSGAVEGRITSEMVGDGGFGYDPLFVPEGYDATFGVLSAEVKNEISHRGRALARLIAELDGTRG